MYISKFRILNYKSYLDSGIINFKQGINIITGQNNNGKTALLHALSLQFNSRSHKSTKTLPLRDTVLNPTSNVILEFVISRKDIEKYVTSLPQISIPQSNSFSGPNSLQGTIFFDKLGEFNTIRLGAQNHKIMSASCDLFGLPSSSASYIYNISQDKKQLIPTQNTVDNQNSIFVLLSRLFITRIYVFDAERFSIGSSDAGTNVILSPNAENLAEVLNNLQWNTSRFEKYNSYVRKIFPNVHKISVRTIKDHKVEIVVWNEDPNLEREDLVVPLSQSGTGIGQVLAILYVVLTSNFPSVIAIDEPNSFLHPGASRKLMGILKEYSQHQFIISSHSPEIISSSNPTTINIIKNVNAQSTVSEINIREAKNQQLFLSEIGSKLSDVFGADNILWVEGRTEELCFPKIIEKMNGISQMGTSILAVKHTGDFDGKQVKTIFDIYNKLSKGQDLIPPAVGFIFDREGKSEQQMTDLKTQSKNTVVFTERKMFENYIVHLKAIHTVINAQGITIPEEIIEKWIEANKWDVKFISKAHAEGNIELNWLLYVDGAKFLAAMFTQLTDSKLEFHKITHSIALAEWVIENSFDDLKEYQEILKGFLEENTV